MSTRSERWPEGTPCWVDLSATDQQAAISFYSTLFGWQVQDTGAEFGHYGMAMIGGQTAAGIGELPPGQTGQAAWTTYLASNDADKTCELISSAGGTVVMPPMDVGTSGRMAIAQDPTGAFFGIWQAGDMPGTTIVNEPGAVGWNECRTRDPQRAREFYAAVFGHTFTKMAGDEEYWTIDGAGPGNTVGGLCPLDPGVAGELPAHWMTYFVAADTDDAVAIVSANGGRLHLGPWDTPFGRMAVVSDPQGAMFSIAGMPPEGTGS